MTWTQSPKVIRIRVSKCRVSERQIRKFHLQPRNTAQSVLIRLIGGHFRNVPDIGTKKELGLIGSGELMELPVMY